MLQNESLKQQLHGPHSKQHVHVVQHVVHVHEDGRERELSELKLMARQSQSLNSQLKKGMKHLATCRRKKCHVCAYTKEAFGEYANRSE